MATESILPAETRDTELALAIASLPDPLLARAQAYLAAAKAPATLRAYRGDWRGFAAWCAGRGRSALPATPETVALYLADHAPLLRPATLTRRLTAIARAHEAAGHASPASLKHAAVAETLKGIRRVHGTAQTGKAPLLTAEIRKLLAHLPPGPLGDRDRALVLVGYCGAFRRAELAGLRLGDLAWSEEGVAVRLRRSKTDQEGKGRTVAIPRGAHRATCPVRALEGWLKAARIDRSDTLNQDKPLFRAVDRHSNVRATPLDPNSIARILKRTVAHAGYAPAGYAGHSLRAGFATQAARLGASAFDIMRQTGHRSVAVVSRYIREAELFRDSPAGKLGL